MASIYGFTLKNRKTFQGLYWQGNQGDLCYKGKKVAWYNDSGNGGSCDIVYYDNSYAPILEETIKRYFKERPIITEYGELDGDEDLFMAELLQLMDDEKAPGLHPSQYDRLPRPVESGVPVRHPA